MPLPRPCVLRRTGVARPDPSVTAKCVRSHRSRSRRSGATQQFRYAEHDAAVVRLLYSPFQPRRGRTEQRAQRHGAVVRERDANCRPSCRCPGGDGSIVTAFGAQPRGQKRKQCTLRSWPHECEGESGNEPGVQPGSFKIDCFRYCPTHTPPIPSAVAFGGLFLFLRVFGAVSGNGMLVLVCRSLAS